MGPFGVNDEEGIRDKHGVPVTDHGKSSNAVKRQYMGDAGGRRRTRGSGNAIDKDLHR